MGGNEIGTVPVPQAVAWAAGLLQHPRHAPDEHDCVAS